jgi:uncharacterized protein YbjQ (UPF0145 family)
MLSVTTPTIDGRRVTRYLQTIQVGSGSGMRMVSASGTAVVPD